MVELLLALVIIGVAGAAVIEAVGYARTMALKAAYIQAATIAVQNQIDIKRSEASTLAAGTTTLVGLEGLPDDSAAEVTVKRVSGTSNLWSVSVRVTWNAGGRLSSASGSLSQETFVYAP